jgi:hypothetical protein
MSRKSVKAALVSCGAIAACLIALVFPAYTASVGSQAFQSPWQKVLVMIGQESRGQGYTVMAQGGSNVRGRPSGASNNPSNPFGLGKSKGPTMSPSGGNGEGGATGPTPPPQGIVKQESHSTPPPQGTVKPDK